MSKSTVSHKRKMYGLVREWEESGIRQRPFCEQKGLNFSKFQYWRTKYKKVRPKINQNKEEPVGVGFLPITADEPSMTKGVHILYPNGVRLEFSGELILAEISQLIRLF